MLSRSVRCLCLVSILLAPAPAQAQKSAAPAPELKLRIAHVYDEKYAWHRSFERFRDVLKARSGGKIDVQIFPRSTLGNEREYVSYLRQGTLDGATVSTAAVSTVAPELAFLDLMYLWEDREHWRRALDGDVGRRMAEAVRTGTARAGLPGLEVLGYWGGNQMHVVSRTRAYKTLADLAGVKMRVQDSAVQMESWKLLGTLPLNIAYDAVHASLKEGLVEAAISVSASSLNMKFYEVAPYVTETNHAITVRPFLFSGQTWSKLTPEQRKQVTEAAREATTVDRALEAQDEEEAVAEMKTKHGVKFQPFGERALMRDKTQPVRERVARELKLDDVLAGIEKDWDAPAGDKGAPRKKK
jgi:TRAP-type transport system periplasmic protein